jgi:hypothetical protein
MLAAESKEQSTMSFGIASIEHFFARAAKGAATAVKAIAGVANNPTVEADAATIEKLTGLISPQAEAIEDAAYQSFGLVAKAATDAEHPLNADGSLSVTIGAEIIADIKALVPSVESFASLIGLKKPAAAAASKS